MLGLLRQHRIPHRLAAATSIVLIVAGLQGPAMASDGGEKATTPRQERSWIQRVSHSVFQPFWQVQRGEVEPFRLPSKYYGPWEPTEVFGRDARCAPSPYAPRGYGFPKHLSLYRMEYNPFRLSDCPHSSHGPALWMRHHRDPCCDASGGACHECLDRSVDPQ